MSATLGATRGPLPATMRQHSVSVHGIVSPCFIATPLPTVLNTTRSSPATLVVIQKLRPTFSRSRPRATSAAELKSSLDPCCVSAILFSIGFLSPRLARPKAIVHHCLGRQVRRWQPYAPRHQTPASHRLRQRSPRPQRESQGARDRMHN